MSQPTPGEPQTTAVKRGQPTGWRKWAFRLAAMTLVPALLFGLLEVTLRVSNFGYVTDYFLDGSRIEGPGTVVDNPDFGRWAFPVGMQSMPQPMQFSFAEVKPSKTFRVFVVGESAALGYPDPSLSFPRVLEVMLKNAYPDQRIEVINTSMVAINSHVVLPIAQQCLQRDADLLVVHLGNNEVVGPFGAAGVLGPYAPTSGVVRANLLVKSMRTGQMLGRFMHWLKSDSSAPSKWEGMAMFRGSRLQADDERLERIRANFRANLQDICQAGSAAGVPVIVCTIPVNLKDCAPFASVHASDLSEARTKEWDKHFQEGVRLEEQKKFAEASRCYEEAAKIDGEYAELAYRRGQCALASGKLADARTAFVQACELDALRFRSDTGINEVIRSTSTANGATLADLEKAFADSSPGGVPGEDYFLEHVHMNFHGNYQAARTIFTQVAKLAPKRLGAPGDGKAQPLSESACAERLGFNDWANLAISSVILKMFEKAPFSDQFDHAARDQRWKSKVEELRPKLVQTTLNVALAQLQKAVDADEFDWQLRMNYGQLLRDAGDLPRAREQYQAVVGRLRHCYLAHAKLGTIALKMGRADEAHDHFQRALQLAPEYKEANYGLARTLANQGKVDEACALFQREVDKEVERAAALTLYGTFLERVGKPDQAKARFLEAINLEPKNSLPHARLGDLALKQNNPAEALQHYETALSLAPAAPELSERVAKLRQSLGK